MGEAYTGFWWVNLRERDDLVEPSVDGRKRKCDVGVWTGLILLRIETVGGNF
jgi:hypothetical protein